MRLVVDYYEFPKLDGRIIPRGDRYNLTVDVSEIEDERELLKELYKIVSSEVRVPTEQLKIMGWKEI